MSCNLYHHIYTLLYRYSFPEKYWWENSSGPASAIKVKETHSEGAGWGQAPPLLMSYEIIDIVNEAMRIQRILNSDTLFFYFAHKQLPEHTSQAGQQLFYALFFNG